MNDVQRAIETVNANIEITEILESERMKELNFALKVSKAALEKQIPKKPLQKQLNVNKDLIGLCPVCKEMWVIKYKEYCANCGQKLVWSEVEE